MYCVVHGIDNIYNFYTKSYNLAQECTSVQFPLLARDLNSIKRYLSKISHCIVIILTNYVTSHFFIKMFR